MQSGWVRFFNNVRHSKVLTQGMDFYKTPNSKEPPRIMLLNIGSARDPMLLTILL